MARIFLSYSSFDRAIARKLYYGLKSQGLEIWDYSQRGEEIPWGMEIPDVLRERIRESDFFVPVISRHSVDADKGKFTRVEVRAALELGFLARGKILPVVLKGSAPRPEVWSEPYAVIADVTYLEWSDGDWYRQEETLATICRFLGVQYMPAFRADLHLPLPTRLERELQQRGLSVAQYEHLMLIAAEVMRQMEEGDWFEADMRMSYFLMTCRFHHPPLDLYYPLIVKGVCELQLGRFAEAEQTFLTARRHHEADENSAGGLGQVYFRRAHYEDALSAYRDALRLCRPGCDAETRWNILSTETMLGRMPEDLSSLDTIRLEDLNGENRIRVQNVRLKVLWNRKNHRDARSLLEEMLKQRTYNATTVVNGYSMLKEGGQHRAALELLKREARNLEDVNLYHHLAHLYVELGQLSDAVDVFERRICIPVNNTRQYMIEYARLLAAAGRIDESRKVCRAVLSREYFPLPASTEDFFYEGYANYMLGHMERARYDHERSSGLGHEYYTAYD